MLIKILSAIILISVGYGITVFLYPQTAKNIDTLIGVPGLSETIRGGKEVLDTTATEIPSFSEIQDGAVNAKDKIINGVETTKEGIDTIRGSFQKAEDTYNEVQQDLENIQDTIESGKESFNAFEEKFNQLQEALNGKKSDENL